jgi:hypothetical protein
MIRWFLDLLYGGVPAEFESAFGLEESVQRLSAATCHSVFSTFTRQTAFGKVRSDRVSLQRAIPFFGNSFKPFFKGSFRIVNDRVILSGTFTMLWWVKAFETLWFGFCLLWTALAINRDPDKWSLPFAGVGMFILGVAFLWFSKWLSRNDIPWLSAVIHDALTKDPNDSMRRNTPQAARA